jgi:hypothetical protein
VIDVASLGMVVFLARDVADPGGLGEFAERLAAAIVEDVDMQLLGRVIDIVGGEGGITNQRKRFIVGGDEHVDVRPEAFVIGQGKRLALQRRAGLHETHDHDEDGVGFGGEQDQHEEGIDGVAAVGLVGEELKDGVESPPAVAQRGGERDDHEGEGNDVRPGEPVEQYRGQDADAAEQNLLGPAEIKTHELQQQKQAGKSDDEAEATCCGALRAKEEVVVFHA